jgi:hypothetical protein
MAATPIQRVFAPFKRLAPAWLSNAVRRGSTAMLTPLYFSARSGHFRSSIRQAAVSPKGEPIPWYTFPCIEFLQRRDFAGRSVLEFGGGQSSMWWGAKAAKVVTFEGDREWHDRIREEMPSNVDLRLAAGQDAEERMGIVRSSLEAMGDRRFDIVVIDGLDRRQLVPLACQRLADGGVIICDNAEGYGFHEAFRGLGMSRVDFYGHAPGVILPHCTSFVFRGGSWLFAHDSAPISVEYGW